MHISASLLVEFSFLALIEVDKGKPVIQNINYLLTIEEYKNLKCINLSSNVY